MGSVCRLGHGWKYFNALLFVSHRWLALGQTIECCFLEVELRLSSVFGEAGVDAGRDRWTLSVVCPRARSTTLQVPFRKQLLALGLVQQHYSFLFLPLFHDFELPFQLLELHVLVELLKAVRVSCSIDAFAWHLKQIREQGAPCVVLVRDSRHLFLDVACSLPLADLMLDVDGTLV